MPPPRDALSRPASGFPPPLVASSLPVLSVKWVRPPAPSARTLERSLLPHPPVSAGVSIRALVAELRRCAFCPSSPPLPPISACRPL